MKKIVLFGAGKIGRSFIGQLFSRAGYEVVFIDTDERIIKELIQRRSYNVIIKSDSGDETLNIRNVRGIQADNRVAVISELTDCDYVATAVGQTNLAAITPLLARGIKSKWESGNTKPTDIILAENLRNAAGFIKNFLKQYLPVDYPLDEKIGLIETSIGKMVPIMSEKDIREDVLQVYAEPYNTLILDKKGFRNELPDVPGLAPKENMKAWVDRKSFIHNLGHASAAYYGNYLHPEAAYMYEVLADSKVYRFTHDCMDQSADALLAEYPEEFTVYELTDHIEDLLKRFQNKALGDTVFRVGLDLYRKLGPEDRLAGSIRLSLKHKLPHDKILAALIFGTRFKARDENGSLYPRDKEFHSNMKNKRTEYFLSEVCGFKKSDNRGIFQLAEKLEKNFLNNPN